MNTLTEGRADPRAYLCTLPDDAVVNAAEAAAMIGVSVRHFDRLVKAGSAPRPLSGLGRQVRRFRMGALRSWLEAAQAG
jgi:predicted DNA-binding transcriptional regulator AlpA